MYLLDTNTVSYLMRANDAMLKRRMRSVPMTELCISAITEAELWAGLARLESASKLYQVVGAFLQRMIVLPFNSETARTYGSFREAVTAEGRALGALDMLIAAHALSVGATLVSSDKAFKHIDHLVSVEDWSDL